jgi:L-lactate dehydrogenase complex protein LldG
MISERRSMDSREDILGRIRQRLGRSAANVDAARAGLTAVLKARTQGPRPPVGPDLVARLREKSEVLSSTVDIVPGAAQVPAAAARYLGQHGLPLRAVCVPEVAHLDWAGAGLAVEARAAREDDLVGITGSFCAIAETGTLMLCSTPDSPATVSLLPETHIAIVDAQRIVPGMEEAWQLAREHFGDLPRAVNFISGPSRTGDIEQTIVLGAHGPYRVHLILVTG